MKEERIPIGKFIYTSPITGDKTYGEYHSITPLESRFKEGELFKRITGIWSTNGPFYELKEIEIIPYEEKKEQI